MDAVVQHPRARVPIPASQAAPVGHPRPTREQAEAAVRTLIAWAGDDPMREGLIDTPRRVVRAYGELFGGYGRDAAKDLDRVFEDVQGYDDMVVLRDIPYFSHCEHHMVPFFGKAHVAYIPNGHIVGLSKIPRIVDAYARRLQVQERLTVQVRNCIEETLKPLGVAVVIEAQHLCMQMRGIQKQHSIATTSAFTGEFNSEKTRAEFMRLVTSGSHAR